MAASSLGTLPLWVFFVQSIHIILVRVGLVGCLWVKVLFSRWFGAKVLIRIGLCWVALGAEVKCEARAGWLGAFLGAASILADWV